MAKVYCEDESGRCTMNPVDRDEARRNAANIASCIVGAPGSRLWGYALRDAQLADRDAFHEETIDPLVADARNFARWKSGRDATKVDSLLRRQHFWQGPFSIRACDQAPAAHQADD